jgi:hypothetical protein
MVRSKNGLLHNVSSVPGSFSLKGFHLEALLQGQFWKLVEKPKGNREDEGSP